MQFKCMRVESAQCIVCSTLPVLKLKAGITDIHRAGKNSLLYDSVSSPVLSPFPGSVKYSIPGASPPASSPGFCPEAAGGLTAPQTPSCIKQ